MKERRNIETLSDLLNFEFMDTLCAARIKYNSQIVQFDYCQFKLHVHTIIKEYEKYDWENKQVVLIGNSGYGWVLQFFAITLKGGTAVIIDSKLPKQMALNLINRTETNECIIDEKCQKKWRLTSLESKALISFSNDPNSFKKQKEELKELIHVCHPEQIAVIAFTSGTTGTSKMVMLTHKNLCSDIMSCYDYFGDKIGPNISIMPVIPFYHMFGLTAGILIPIYYGMPINYIDSLKYISICIKEMQPQLLLAVPVILENMLCTLKLMFKGKENKEEIVKQFLGGKMQIIVSGGAKLKDDICKSFTDMGILMCNGYGMTECSPIITCNAIKNNKLGSVGKVIDDKYKEVKIVDDEIMVRGNIVMKGYYKNDEENAKIFRNGWLATGDLGYIDQEGYLFLTGRKKNLIILSDGNNVSPEELEALLESYLLINNALVSCESGDNYDYLKASILPNYKFDKGYEQIDIEEQIHLYVKELNQKLPSYKRIAKVYIVKEELEKNILGKVKRNYVN